MSYNLGNTDAITYDGKDVEKLTLDGTTIWEKSTSALTSAFIAAQQACDPTADLDGYLYDENHYLIRYVSMLYLGSYTARGQVYELYCYGSDDSFVTPPTFSPFYPLEAKTLSLFDTSICVGWASWQFGAQIGGAEMQAASLVASTTYNAILNHTLNVSGGGSSTGVSTKNYRQYIHPENCSVLGQNDPYYANSAASILPTSDRVGELVENNGGLNSHKEALELVGLSKVHISVYPIKKVKSTSVADKLNDLPPGTVVNGEVALIGPYSQTNAATYTKTAGNKWSVGGFNTGVTEVEFRDSNGVTQALYTGPTVTQTDLGRNTWHNISFAQRAGTGSNSNYTVVMEGNYMDNYTAAWYSSTALTSALT